MKITNALTRFVNAQFKERVYSHHSALIKFRQTGYAMRYWRHEVVILYSLGGKNISH